MKKILISFLFIFSLCGGANTAYASIFDKLPEFKIDIPGIAGFAGIKLGALDELNKNVYDMAKMINEASSEMMKFGDMLMCNALHGEASYMKPSFMGITFEIQLFDPEILLSGCIFYILGFFIMMICSFYMFDVAFNLSICMALLPIALALWPFGWTRDKLKSVIDSIVYYTGVFIFLPLGILISQKLVETVADNAIGAASGGEFDFRSAYNEDKADLIKDNLGIFTLPFLKILLCYVVAIRIIPLMANDFCNTFFGRALVGNPMSQTVSQLTSELKERTIGKMAKYGKDVVKHQLGKQIESAGNKNGGFWARTVARYGKNMANTRKKRP